VDCSCGAWCGFASCKVLLPFFAVRLPDWHNSPPEFMVLSSLLVLARLRIPCADQVHYSLASDVPTRWGRRCSCLLRNTMQVLSSDVPERRV
jgi:hypothetical protein